MGKYIPSYNLDKLVSISIYKKDACLYSEGLFISYGLLVRYYNSVISLNMDGSIHYWVKDITYNSANWKFIYPLPRCNYPKDPFVYFKEKDDEEEVKCYEDVHPLHQHLITHLIENKNKNSHNKSKEQINIIEGFTSDWKTITSNPDLIAKYKFITENLLYEAWKPRE